MRARSLIPVVDLFAGPGGLGEGFSSFQTNGKPFFRVALSIEKDEIAHRTLELRSFFRQFPDGEAPSDYYEYLRGDLSRSELFGLYPREAQQARSQAWHATLGEISEQELDRRIRSAIHRFKRWVLVGGPPCQAYSLVGRSRMRGGANVDFDKDERHYLYKEYLSILARHQPPVFIMENVKGLLSSTVNGVNIFQLIVNDLAKPLQAVDILGAPHIEYRLFPVAPVQQVLHPSLESRNPADYVVRFENHGVPQRRHRVIILGVRKDWLDRTGIQTPPLLDPREEIPVEDVIGDLPPLRSGVSRGDSFERWIMELCTLTGTALWQVSPSVRGRVLGEARAALAAAALVGDRGRGQRYVATKEGPRYAEEWFRDEALGGVCGHETRRHMASDLQRYLFTACFGAVHGFSPTMRDFPECLLPAHKNAANALTGSYFADRFRVQVTGRPATTITSHISKDGHAFIHYDPAQCRSLTVREAARLQTFPDNYFFEGNRTQQYAQIGNAVPPLAAREIAGIVWRLLSGRIKRNR